MNNFLKRLSLPVKLVIIGLIPFLLLLLFAIQVLDNKNERLKEIGDYRERVIRASALSNLIDEVQSERKWAFEYAFKKTGQAEMVLQRSKVDAAIKQVEDLSAESLPGIRRFTFLDDLTQMRSRIDNGQAYAVEVMTFYTNTIYRLNTFNDVSAGKVQYLQPVLDDLIGQKLFSEMVTFLGIARSGLYLILDTRMVTAEGVDRTKQVYDIYNTYVRELEARSPATYQQYKSLTRDPDMTFMLSTFDKVSNSLTVDTTLPSSVWWKRSSDAVDKMRNIQSAILNRLTDTVGDIYAREEISRNLTVAAVIIMLALVVLFLGYVVRQISETLNNLKHATDELAAGKSGIRLRVESEDVVGGLTQSILDLDANNQKLARAAEQIGQGNFEVPVQPRSSEDLLGNAIVQMKNDLQAFHSENEQKIWMQTGKGLVNDAIRGDKNLDVLGHDALAAVADFIECETGLLYASGDDYLSFVAGRALADKSMVPREISYGERLTGQAAQQKKMMVVQDIPEDYLKISSVSGDAPPRQVVILPLLQNDLVEGVMELASFSPIDSRKQEFLREISTDIAIAVHGAKNRARMQELFEQTQAQAEELQAQHSELESMNAELEAQAHRLQASEEELRVQQEELQQTNRELEERSRLLEEKNQLIVERNLEIQQKAEELELSTKYKSEFLANMSHELRTPLNSILLLSRLLADNNEKNLSPDQVEYAQVIRNSGTSLLSLIDEILDLSKIEAGKMELEYSFVPVKEVAESMRSLFLPIAREKGLEMHISYGEGLPGHMETDRMRLEQILKNLLSNALKFTAKGSVILDIRVAPEQPNFLSFTVTDTGIGIAKDKQALIFEAFQQEDGSTRRKYGGTGLGLSISRELAKLLGGKIKVVSEAGKGSSFTILIPLRKPAPSPAPEEPALLAPLPAPQEEEVKETPVREEKRNLRVDAIPEGLPDDRDKVSKGDKVILIIEDDTAFAKALLDFTRSQGYKGIVAVRGDEGVELARQFRPIGILLDIQLPVRDGWEVMEELKANPVTRPIPVHMMSVMEAKKESLMKGAIDFINKPVAFEQMQEVFQKIEQVLSKKDKKVLIVEENPKHARALAYFLETFNVSSEVSNSVSQSVAALKQEGVDCVILDMGIPDVKAYETLEEIKNQSGMENLPVIIFTGKSLSNAEESRIRQYADSIVVKTAHSYQRVLDEVSLFLHLVEEGMQEEGVNGKSYKRLGALNEILKGKKILITDDDVRNIFSLTKALEGHGMEVFSAIDGKEALLQLEAQPDMDVVLMDIMMPEMDGYETMRALRRNAKFRTLPVIAVTAKAMTGDREKCIQAGASDYISKPVDVDQLLSLLRVWLYDKKTV